MELDHYADSPSQFLQFLGEFRILFLRTVRVCDHHHVEVPSDYRLGYVEDVDVVLCKVRAYLRYYSDLVFAFFGDYLIMHKLTLSDKGI